MAVSYTVTAYNRSESTGLDHSMLFDTATVLHAGYTSRRIANAKLVEERNKIEAFTFTIYPGNPGYDVLKTLDTIITIDEDVIENQGSQAWYVNGTTLVCPSDVSLSGSSTLDTTYTATTVEVNGTNMIVGGEESTEQTRIFDGRVLMVEDKLDTSGLVYRDVTCEGLAGFLNDSVQPYEPAKTYEDTEGEDWNTGLYKFVTHLLEGHNDTVKSTKEEGHDTYKTVYMGTVDKSTHLTNTQVTKGLNWQTTWEAMTDKLVDSFGGEMRVWRKTNVYDDSLQFDYRDALGETHEDNVIRLSENLKSMTVTPDYSAIITRLYPLGDYKTITTVDEDGNVTEEQDEDRIKINDPDDDGKTYSDVAYIEDTDAQEKYGIVAAVNVWEDVTEPKNLLSKAKEWLAENNKVDVSVTLDAYDLSIASSGMPRFNLYDSYLVDAPLLGFSEYLEIVKKTTDINDPLQSTYEFGKVAKTSTSRIVGGSNDTLPAEKTQVNISYQVSVSNHTLEVTRKVKYV